MPLRKIPGLICATRAPHDKLRHLPAWLDHHLRWAERAVVAVDCPGGRFESVTMDYLKRRGVFCRPVYRALTGGMFHCYGMLRELSAMIARSGRARFVLYLDVDEFIPDFVDVDRIIGEMEKDYLDCATGFMACRVGPGLSAFPSTLGTYEEYRHAAPVRCEIRKYQQHLTQKVWLTRWPQVLLHEYPVGYRAHPQQCVIDHFVWHEDRLRDSEGKHRQHAHHAGLDRRFREDEESAHRRDAAFVRAARDTFLPVGCSLPGWFDYEDLYRALGEWLSPGASFVELGVFRGRSLSFLAEYLTLLGKKVRMTGVDVFDNPERGMTDSATWQHGRAAFDSSDELYARVRQDVAYAAPWQDAQLLRARTTDAAAQFADGSVDAVFVDAAHDFESVRDDLRAWLPKLRPGGVLAGHDLCHSFPGVERALREVGVPFRKVSARSWLATGERFGDPFKKS